MCVSGTAERACRTSCTRDDGAAGVEGGEAAARSRGNPSSSAVDGRSRASLTPRLVSADFCSWRSLLEATTASWLGSCWRRQSGDGGPSCICGVQGVAAGRARMQRARCATAGGGEARPRRARLVRPPKPAHMMPAFLKAGLYLADGVQVTVLALDVGERARASCSDRQAAASLPFTAVKRPHSLRACCWSSEALAPWTAALAPYLISSHLHLAASSSHLGRRAELCGSSPSPLSSCRKQRPGSRRKGAPGGRDAEKHCHHGQKSPARQFITAFISLRLRRAPLAMLRHVGPRQLIWTWEKSGFCLRAQRSPFLEPPARAPRAIRGCAGQQQRLYFQWRRGS